MSSVAPDRIEYLVPMKKQIWSLLMTAFFLIGSLYLGYTYITSPEGVFTSAEGAREVIMRPLITYVAPPFFLLFFTFTLLNALNRKPILSADREGISLRLVGNSKIPWSVVREIRPVQVGLISAIGVFPKDLDSAIASVDDKVAHGAFKSNFKSSGAIAIIDPAHLPDSPSVVIYELERLRISSIPPVTVPFDIAA